MVKTLYRFQVCNSMTCHLYLALCAHHPKPNLLHYHICPSLPFTSSLISPFPPVITTLLSLWVFVCFSCLFICCFQCYIPHLSEIRQSFQGLSLGFLVESMGKFSFWTCKHCLKILKYYIWILTLPYSFFVLYSESERRSSAIQVFPRLFLRSHTFSSLNTSNNVSKTSYYSKMTHPLMDLFFTGGCKHPQNCWIFHSYSRYTCPSSMPTHISIVKTR